jgi:3-oxoacyl-[acyl-carrier protein] reductase
MKNILIVGGSHGIGSGILKDQRQNHHCINFSRTLPANTDGISNYTLDVLSDELPEIESLDGLVYCPGSINLRPFTSLTETDFRADFEINVMGAVKVLKTYLPLLKKSPHASVVLFSTVAAQTGMSFHASVAASKGAIESMTRALAAELAPAIRINCVAPSLTDTPLAERLLKSDKQKESAALRHPLKRYGQIADLAAAVDFLLHENSSWITGQILKVDGGLSAINQ